MCLSLTVLPHCGPDAMTTFLISWLALACGLGPLVGACIHFGMGGEE